MQPCRVVKAGNAYHFYEKHTEGYRGAEWDVQGIDMGIAICHFMSVMDGKFSISDPGISSGDNIEYIATVTVS